MGRFDSTKAAIDANIKKNDNQEITGSILNYVMNNMIDSTESQLEATDARITEVSDALTEASSEIEVLAIELESQNEMIADLDNMKIDKEADDYYPQLSVGLADNLAGEDVVASEVSFRRSGGGAISDGVARIEAIKGNSVVWNQKVKNNLTEATINGVTFTPQADGGILVNGTASANSFYAITDKNVYKANHKVALIGSKNDVGIAFGGNIVSSNVNKDYIFTKTESFDNQCFLFILSGSVIENVIIYPIVSDLTLMFGVGNEPTTIDEFNARKPLGIDENAYNEGEVIHMDAQSLESVGVNQWDEQWESGVLNTSTGANVERSTQIRSKNYIPIIGGKTYYAKTPYAIWVICYDKDKNIIPFVSGSTQSGLASYINNKEFIAPTNAAYMRFYCLGEYGTTYNHDICINLSDASVNGKHFPYIKRTQSLAIIGEGLKSAGTAHDEIRYNKATQKWENVQRIGSVDMGTLSYLFSTVKNDEETYDVFYTLGIQDIVKHPSRQTLANVLSHEYMTTTNIALTDRVMEDKAMMLYHNGALYIRDDAYTDAASFKAAMQGVILYYELAEPIVTELEDDSNLDYEVWNGGTEKILSDVPTTPLKANIAYGFNAVGKIKELEEKLNNGGGGGVSKDYVDGKLTELSAEVGKLPTKEYVDNAVANAGGGGGSGDDTMTRILAGATPFICYRKTDGTIGFWEGYFVGMNHRLQEDIVEILFGGFGPKPDATQFLNSWKNLERIYPLMNGSGCTNLSFAFMHDAKLKDLSMLKDWDVSQVTNANSCFAGCAPEILPIDNWNIAKIDDMSSMFKDYKGIDVDFSRWTNNVVTKLVGFMRGSSVKKADLHNISTEKCTTFEGAMRGCANLQWLDIRGWSCVSATSLHAMLNDCSQLTTLVGNTAVEDVIAQDIKVLDGYTATSNLSIKESSIPLNRASLRALINGLADMTETGATLPIGSANIAKLSNDDIAVATTKGWTLS